MATNDLMFDEIFVVNELNPEGKKFMMTDRINCNSEVGNLDLILDIHSELFKCILGTKFRMVIVPTFREDGLPDDDEYDPNMSNRMLDRFEYAMCGQVYRIEGGGSSSENNQITVFASYGGLLMRLRGDQLNMQGFKDDSTLYLMVKKLHD
uniref:DNA-directed RNA polymerases I, II, and III subunit RPABC3 n=1 Tax=Panagrolaimus superbus TaxID=310955 RepID=A0A914ZCZ8_9BILA